jgi:hypothetical protein
VTTDTSGRDLLMVDAEFDVDLENFRGAARSPETVREPGWTHRPWP